MIRPLANITVFSGVLTNLYEIEQPPMGWSCNRIVPMFLFFHRDTAEKALSKVHRVLPTTANHNKKGMTRRLSSILGIHRDSQSTSFLKILICR